MNRIEAKIGRYVRHYSVGDEHTGTALLKQSSSIKNAMFSIDIGGGSNQRIQITWACVDTDKAVSVARVVALAPEPRLGSGLCLRSGSMACALLTTISCCLPLLKLGPIPQPSCASTLILPTLLHQRSSRSFITSRGSR